MRFDENFYVSLTLSGNSKESDVFDLGGAGIAEGPGVFVVTVTTKVTAATKVELQTSDDNTNYAAVGTQKVIDVPPGCGRYLKLVATGTSMAGKIDCGLTLAAQSAKGIETFTAN